MTKEELNHLELTARDGNLSKNQGRSLVKELRLIQEIFTIVQQSNIPKDCIRGYFIGTVCV